jgi:excisionase family DNA binding protein
MSNEITVRQAARYLGVTPEHTSHLIRDGRIAARKVGPIWIVSRDELRRIKPTLGRIGRPRTSTKQ